MNPHLLQQKQLIVSKMPLSWASFSLDIFNDFVFKLRTCNGIYGLERPIFEP